MSETTIEPECIDIPNLEPRKPHLESIPSRERKRLMTISVPPSLYAAIDAGTEASGKSRSRFVCEMLLAAMTAEPVATATADEIEADGNIIDA